MTALKPDDALYLLDIQKLIWLDRTTPGDREDPRMSEPTRDNMNPGDKLHSQPPTPQPTSRRKCLHEGDNYSVRGKLLLKITHALSGSTLHNCCVYASETVPYIHLIKEHSDYSGRFIGLPLCFTPPSKDSATLNPHTVSLNGSMGHYFKM